MKNKPITISEALHYLQEAKLRMMSKEGESRKIYENTLEYCQTNSKFGSLHSIHNVTDELKSYNLNENEIVQLCNLFPQSTDEMKVLVPGLSRISEDVLEKVLKTLNAVQDV